MQNAFSPQFEGWKKKLGRLCLMLLKLWGLCGLWLITSLLITEVILRKSYPGLMADENVEVSVTIVNCFSLILLWYAITRRQVNMFLPLLAGIIWFIMQDGLFVLGWIAAAWWLIKAFSEISHPRVGTVIQFLLFFIIIMAYTDTQQFGGHLFYDAIFAVCVILGVAGHYSGVTFFKPKSRQKAPVAASVVPQSSPAVITSPAQEAVTIESRIARLQNQRQFPDELLDQLKTIIEYAQLIVACMKEDPKDVEPGAAFLNRYLPAVEKIANEYTRLSTQLEKHSKADDFLLKNIAVLKALGSAFQQQHERLLENDALDFDTELIFVDNLLKTDGYK
ncbi:5-bromo-4-chloroindolyl phosphate hydrolysis family protein [Brenneria goodwinii]|uniref:5-bromo-4-chloroindolyl phosphate hydrolysis family protein n=1 Tax=Brenneria goodwinii TaxID=1109412 RepID=UPI0036E2014F